MPESSVKILNSFNVDDNVDIFDNCKYDIINNGTKVIEEKENLFVRKDLKEVCESFNN